LVAFHRSAQPRPRLEPHRAAGGQLRQAPAADLRHDAGLWRAARLARENLDHTAQGGAAVQAGHVAAHDLDAFHVHQRQVLDGSGAEVEVVDRDSIDQHQRVARLGATDKCAGHRAAAAVLHDLHAGNALKQRRQVARLRTLDLVARDEGGAGQRVLRPLLGATG
jgi:hypothetical protein